jgi:hypothetical protein
VIVHSLCNTCFQRFELRVEPSDVALLRQLNDGHGLANCPRLCGGKINLGNPSEDTFREMARSPLLKEPVPITAKELFKAVKGGGLPDEIPKSYELGVALFKAHKVKSVFMEQDGKNIYLHEIRFEDGSVMHLAAGMRGAQVLKITKES